MAVLRGPAARRLVPRAPLLPQPPHYIQVPISSGEATGEASPRAALLASPLEDAQVPSPSGPAARVAVPRAPVGPGPLDHVQVARCAAREQVWSSHGQPWRRRHLTRSRFPREATFAYSSGDRALPYLMLLWSSPSEMVRVIFVSAMCRLVAGSAGEGGGEGVWSKYGWEPCNGGGSVLL